MFLALSWMQVFDDPKNETEVLEEKIPGEQTT